MRTESPARMEQRLSNPSRPPRQAPPSHSRKSRRRSGRKNNPLDAWPQNAAPQGDQDGGLVAGVEYPPQMLWQSPSVPGNGQRLFTAMSDPSVCSYSPMPMTYAMQPVSLPAMYRMYQPMPVPNIRTVHSRQRHHCNKHSAHVRPGANNNVANGYESLQENGVLEAAVHIALQNGDYTSLPPTANKDSGVNGDELNSEHRRYSDPGLGPAGNSNSNTDSDSVESGSSVTTISRSNKLVLSLIEQMTELKKCNSQLFKELSETKSNLENVKVKLTQCKHSTPADYQPGMLSELIREIREANKNCEEGLVTKVKSMFEERCNQQAKEMDGLKNQLAKLMKEKEQSDQRVAKLEEEVTVLKLSATLEKLMEILRKKVNGATATVNVSRICDVLASGVCSVPEDRAGVPTNQMPLSSSSEDEQDETEDGDNNDDDDDDDDDDEKLPDTSRSDQNSLIASDSKITLVIDGSVNLSGPVTDL